MATITKLERKRGEAYLIRYVHPVTRKFVRKVVWCNRRDAEKIVKKIEVDIAFGQFNIESEYAVQYTWSQLMNRYLKYSQANKSIKTTNREKIALNIFKEFLRNDLYLTEMTSQIIENYREHRLSKGLSPASVSIEMRILKTVFNQGIKWSMLVTNPVAGVRIPKNNIVKIRFLHVYEIKRLFKVITDDGNYEFLRLVKAYLHSGARRIELLKPLFTWDDVNFDDRKVLIQGLKGNDRRYIPMNSILFEVLNEIRKEGLKYPFEYHPDFVSHKIKFYYRKAGIKDATLHSLRKTFGSLLLQNKKADLITISKLLGHSSVKTTEKYYVDLLDENYRESVIGLEDVI